MGIRYLRRGIGPLVRREIYDTSMDILVWVGFAWWALGVGWVYWKLAQAMTGE